MKTLFKFADARADLVVVVEIRMKLSELMLLHDVLARASSSSTSANAIVLELREQLNEIFVTLTKDRVSTASLPPGPPEPVRYTNPAE